MTPIARRILALFDSLTSLTAEDVAKATGEPLDAIGDALDALVNAGQLRVERRRYRKPLAITSNDSARSGLTLSSLSEAPVDTRGAEGAP